MPKWLISGGQERVSEAKYSASQIDSGELENNLYNMSNRLAEAGSKLKPYDQIRSDKYEAKARLIRGLQETLGKARVEYESSLKAVVDFDWSTVPLGD